MKYQAENNIGNTIEYDVRWYQVKTTIANFTRVVIKEWSLTTHRKRCPYGQQVCDAIKNLNKKQ